MRRIVIWATIALIVSVYLAGPVTGNPAHSTCPPFEIRVQDVDAVVAAEFGTRLEDRLSFRALHVLKGDIPASGSFSLLLPKEIDKLPDPLMGSHALVLLFLRRAGIAEEPLVYAFPMTGADMIPLHRDESGNLLFPGEPCAERWPMSDPHTYQGAARLIRRLVDGIETQDLLMLSLARQAARADILPATPDPERQVAEPSLVKAYAWFAVASILRPKGAYDQDLSRIRSRMTAEELAAGKALAGEYLRICAPAMDHIRSSSSMVQVAAAFAAGDRVERDDLEAYAWYSLARQSGYMPDRSAAEEALPGLAEQLGKADLTRAQARAGAIRQRTESTEADGPATALGARAENRTFGVLERDFQGSSVVRIPWDSLHDCAWLGLYSIGIGNGGYSSRPRGQPVITSIKAWFGQNSAVVDETDANEIDMERVRQGISKLERGEPDHLTLSLVGPPMPPPSKYMMGRQTLRIVVAEGRRPYAPSRTMMLATDGSGRPTSELRRGAEMLQPAESLCLEVYAGTLHHWTIVGATRSYPRQEAVLYQGKDPSVTTEFLKEQARSLLGIEGSFLFNIRVNVDDPPQPSSPCVVFVYPHPTGEVGISPLKIYPNRASAWAKTSAAGDLEASCNLGSAYLQGKGVSRNVETGIRLWTTAAEGGHRRAQSLLGNAFLEGGYVVRNPEQAAHWLTAAAFQGADGGWSSLGHLYEPPDPLYFPAFRVGSPWRQSGAELFEKDRMQVPYLVRDMAQSVGRLLDARMDTDPGVTEMVKTLVAHGHPYTVTLVLKRVQARTTPTWKSWIPHLRRAYRFPACKILIDQARGLELPGWDEP